MARHAVELGGRWILRNAHPAGLFDVGKPSGAVAARAGQNDCDSLGLLILGQRAEKFVDWVALAARLFGIH